MQRVEFGADGIRGYAGEWPLLPPHVVRIGQALGQFAAARSEHPFVVMGRDPRPSGISIATCLTAGLMGQGVDVITLGIMTTPGVAFVTRGQSADLGIIVSASHSPLEMNGIKLVRSSGLRLQREEELEIENLIEKALRETIPYAAATGQESEGAHLVELYVQDHVKRCPGRSLEGLKLVLDCADGAASRVAPDALRRLKAEVVVINNATDGKTTNYHCGSEYARDQPAFLTGEVQQANASYAFALDGDGDRLVVVDAKGNVFDGHDILYILATHYHSRQLLRAGTVVTTHQANRGLEQALKKRGIQTVYTNNGDRHLEAALWGQDYLLAGEPGGNMIVNDGYHTAADAIHTAILLGRVILENSDTPLLELASDLRAKMREYPQVTLSIKTTKSLSDKEQESIQREVKRKQEFLGDTGRIRFWSSSTEPKLYRIMVEGSHSGMAQSVANIAGELRDLIQTCSNHTSLR